ncbi:type II secretion system protein [Thiomicrorhabdus chilensis]|uniref:type II secretion system protein n=1 Tax=Thiomicrorhabdus chilensis TaxID=63656 RepID=UPI00040C3310|nr:type II secretion system protein [Thiomicrorhabdus chilensis]
MMHSDSMTNQKQSGFSLLEIVIALVILGFLTTELVKVTSISRDYDQHKENMIQVSTVKTLLLSFLQTNAYLPCPDTDNDGWENRTGTQCSSDSGKLPHLMLGISQSVATESILFYKVNTEAVTAKIDDNNFSASYFGTASPPTFSFITPPQGVNKGSGNLTICSEAEISSCNASTSNGNILEEAAIAVVVSFGKNGQQTWSHIGSGNVSSLSIVERENADDDDYFWQSPADQADDSIAWLTGYDAKYAVLKSEQGIN